MVDFECTCQINIQLFKAHIFYFAPAVYNFGGRRPRTLLVLCFTFLIFLDFIAFHAIVVGNFVHDYALILGDTHYSLGIILFQFFQNKIKRNRDFIIFFNTNDGFIQKYYNLLFVFFFYK